jgi:phenylalanyl-tRNA synthetase beta chain
LKILVSWLRELVDIEQPVREIADALEGSGFEVAAVEALPPAGDDLEDGVIDLEVTTNRPDCLSVQGIAREVATKFDRLLRHPTIPPLDAAAGADLPLRVVIEDNERCPRYAATVADVSVGPSPSWLASRLDAAGVRPISNIVDITNYVMLELGQPLHAFDHARLAGPEIRVRRARPEETLTTLDSVERQLDHEMLVIADAERAQAIAGVMGGGDSEVSPDTTVVVFESAYFQPAAVRRTARRIGLSTEASYRFERGSNIELPVTALGRVGTMLDQIGAGHMRPGVIDVYPAPRLPLRVLLRHERIARLLGYAVDAVDVERILSALGFRLERLDAPSLTWQAMVPFWRVDVMREADLIEEVARHNGYERLPATFPPLTKAPARPDARLERERVARKIALAAGFSESLTFTFIERTAALRYEEERQLVAIANPLSEKYAVMRPTLLSGLVDSIGHNRRRGRRDVQLFELGATVTAAGGEMRRIAFAWTGSAVPEHWRQDQRPVDFYDMKGALEAVTSALGVRPRFAPGKHPALVPGRTADVLVTGPGGMMLSAGIVGQLMPGVAEAHGLPPHDELYVAELELDRLAPLIDLGEDVRVAPLPRQPASVRDISVLVAATVTAESMRRTIVETAPPVLERVYEFARYSGKGVPEKQVSLSFRLVFRAPDRTLTDAEVQQATDAILAALETAHDARLR